MLLQERWQLIYVVHGLKIRIKDNIMIFSAQIVLATVWEMFGLS